MCVLTKLFLLFICYFCSVAVERSAIFGHCVLPLVYFSNPNTQQIASALMDYFAISSDHVMSIPLPVHLLWINFINLKWQAITVLASVCSLCTVVMHRILSVYLILFHCWVDNRYSHSKSLNLCASIYFLFTTCCIFHLKLYPSVHVANDRRGFSFP